MVVRRINPNKQSHAKLLGELKALNRNRLSLTPAHLRWATGGRLKADTLTGEDFYGAEPAITVTRERLESILTGLNNFLTATFDQSGNRAQRGDSISIIFRSKLCDQSGLIALSLSPVATREDKEIPLVMGGGVGAKAIMTYATNDERLQSPPSHTTNTTTWAFLSSLGLSSRSSGFEKEFKSIETDSCSARISHETFVARVIWHDSKLWFVYQQQ
jgi:hypothetical protein